MSKKYYSCYWVALILTVLFFCQLAAALPPNFAILGDDLYTSGDAAHLGEAVAAVGDIDGDGVGDFAGGAPNHTVSGVSNAGEVAVFSGDTGQVILSLDIGGHAIGFAEAVSAAGDVNNDGTPDILVGATGGVGPGASGWVFVFSGDDGYLIHTNLSVGSDDTTSYPNHSSLFGSQLDSLGDINSDGYDDFIVGGPYVDYQGKTDSGVAVVFSGFDGSRIYTLTGDYVANNHFGVAVSNAGDFNSDSVNDIAVGFRGPSQSGVYVYSGANGALLKQFTGSSASEFYGVSVDELGDINNDGVGDLIVAAPTTGVIDEFNAYVVSGTNGSKLHTFAGNWNSIAGHEVVNAGDVNGDGDIDFLVGDVDSQDSPRFRIFSGDDGSVLHEIGPAPVGSDRKNFATLGDINSDGSAEFIIGGDTIGTSQAGNNGQIKVYGYLTGCFTYPASVLLQNETVTNTQDYFSAGFIAAGESVDVGQTTGDYIISSTGDVELTAREQIRFEPGFSVQVGGVLTANVDSALCD